MELSKEHIITYFETLFHKRDVILAAIEKNPIKGIDISKLDNKQKIFLGGLQKLKFDIDAEILSVYNFITAFYSDIEIVLLEELVNKVKEIQKSQIQLFDFEGDEIKFNENIDTILKDIK